MHDPRECFRRCGEEVGLAFEEEDKEEEELRGAKQREGECVHVNTM